jgi:hypothetical protein
LEARCTAVVERPKKKKKRRRKRRRRRRRSAWALQPLLHPAFATGAGRAGALLLQPAI